jgi:hypothetical protein
MLLAKTMFGSNSIDRFALHPHSAVQQTRIMENTDLVFTEKRIGFINLTLQNIATESKKEPAQDLNHSLLWQELFRLPKCLLIVDQYPNRGRLEIIVLAVPNTMNASIHSSGSQQQRDW